jgi:hypothetical protein
MGVFCEDIREEAQGSFTLVGLMPDNVGVEVVGDGNSPPTKTHAYLGKLCIFARANFDPNDKIKDIQLNLIHPNGTEIPVGGADATVLETAKKNALEKGNPLAGVIMRAVLGGFRLTGYGLLRLEAVVDSETVVLAALNFEPNNPAISSTEQRLLS